jgi:hypothetical protein
MDGEGSSTLLKGLEKLYVDLTDAAISANRIYKTAKKPQDFYTHQWKLRPDVRDLLGKKRASVEELLAAWIPEWKAQGRLSSNGSTICIAPAQAKLLGLEPNSKINVYDLSNRICSLFE